MTTINDNQQNGKQSLTERLDNWWLSKNTWKGLNGGCEILADVAKTLMTLTESVMPRREDLGTMVRVAVEGKDKLQRSLEEIWAGKISEGATHVGILDGVFHFFKHEDILPEENVDLRISAMPPILQLREEEKNFVVKDTHVKEVRFRDDNSLPGAGTGDRMTVVSAGNTLGDLYPLPALQPGVDFAAGDTALS